MFQRFFNDWLVDKLKLYIEDFDENGLEFDGWNGTIRKQNVILKKDALDLIGFFRFVGAPLKIRKGTLGLLHVEFPWSQILSKPCVIKLRDLHLVIDTPGQIDKYLAEKILHSQLKARFEELLKKFKVSLRVQRIQDQKQQKDEAQEEQDGYFKRMLKAIINNLQVVIETVHFRFEDKGVSRRRADGEIPQQFNFGLHIEQILYSQTNSLFQRKFISMEDQNLEKRTFTMLEVKQASVYWNSHTEGNWSDNEDFMSCTPVEFIRLSNNDITERRRKFDQQGAYRSKEYIIQPFDITLKWRGNLNQAAQPHVPQKTTNLIVSEFNLVLDEDILKDMQYLVKLWSWHGRAANKYLAYYQFRPGYDLPVKGNAIKYFQYAVRAVMYNNKKKKQIITGYLSKKRTRQMQSLAILYSYQLFNKWVSENLPKNSHSTTMRLECDDKKFNDQTEFDKYVIKIERKLTAEQMVVAYTKAEKDCQPLIEQEKQNQGWGTWIKSLVWSQSQTDVQQYQLSLQEQNKLIDKLDQIEQINLADSGIEVSMDASDSIQQGENLTIHFVLQVNKLSVALILNNQTQHHLDGMQFMLLQAHKLQFQELVTQLESKGTGQEKVVNEESEQLFIIQGFQVTDQLCNLQKFKSLFKKRDLLNENLYGGYRRKQSNAEDQLSEISEADEEAPINVNNGMIIIQDFKKIKKGFDDLEYFLALHTTNMKTNFLRGIAKPKTFRKEPLINKVKNITLILTDIELFYNQQLVSNLKLFGEQMKIKKLKNAAEADFAKEMEEYNNQQSRKIQKELKQSVLVIDCRLNSIRVIVPDSLNFQQAQFLVLQTRTLKVMSQLSGKVKNSHLAHLLSKDIQFDQSDKNYSIQLQDLRAIFIQDVEKLQSYLYKKQANQAIDQALSVLKKIEIVTDIVVSTKQMQVKVGIMNSINFEVTNKQIQSLKNFVNNTVEYHKKLTVIETEPEVVFDEFYYFDEEVKAVPLEDSGNNTIELRTERSLNQSTGPLLRRNTSDSFQSALDQDFHEFQDFDDDQFFDAEGTEFDQNIIQQVEKLGNSMNAAVIEQEIEEPKEKKDMIISLQIPKIKLQIDEAEEVQQNEEIKNRLGALAEYLDIHTKKKPFLELEVMLLNLLYLKNKQITGQALQIQSVQLSTVEFNDQKYFILNSTRADLQNYSSYQDSKRGIYEPQMEDDLEDEKLVSFINLKEADTKSMKINIQGDLIIDLSDHFIVNFLKVLNLDEQPQQQDQIVAQEDDEPQSGQSNIDFAMKTLKIVLKNRKDKVQLDLNQISFNQQKFDGQKSIQFAIEDMQLKIDDKYELILKYYENHDMEYEEQPMIFFSSDETQEINLNYMYLIVDFKSILKVLLILKAFQSHIKPSKQPVQIQEQKKQSKKLIFKINESFIEVPTEGSNHVFVDIEELTLAKFESRIDLSCQFAQIFIASHFRQNQRYNLIEAINLNTTILGKSIDCNLDSVNINLNENYFILFYKLIDENFDEIALIMGHLKQNRSEEVPQVLEKDHHADVLQLFDKQYILEVGPKTQSMIIFNLSKLKVEWMIGQSFEDHNEKFITLNDLNNESMLEEFVVKAFNESSPYPKKIKKTDEVDSMPDASSVSDQTLGNEMPQLNANKKKSSYRMREDRKMFKDHNFTKAKIVLGFQEFNFAMRKDQDEPTVIKVLLESTNLVTQEEEIISVLAMPKDCFSLTKELDMNVTVGPLTVRLCPAVIENAVQITKGLYNCKNFIQKGRFQKAFSKGEDQPVEVVQNESKSLQRIDLTNVKLIILDQPRKDALNKSQSHINKPQTVDEFDFEDKEVDVQIQENDDQIETQLQHTAMKSSLISSFGDLFAQKKQSKNTISAKMTFILEFKASILLSKSKEEMQNYFTEEVMNQGMSSITLFKLKELQIYQNKIPIKLDDLQRDNIDKMMILHPIDLLMKQGKLNVADLKREITSIQISNFEMEFSAKQLFKLQTIYNNMSAKLKTIKTLMKSSSKKLAQNKATQLQLSIQSVFITVVDELAEGHLITEQDETGCQPFFELETSKIQMNLNNEQLMSNKLSEVRLETNVQLYYFNQTLNFFEPFLEKSQVRFNYHEVSKKNDNKQIEMQLDCLKLVNINLSVAAFECLFAFQSVYKKERRLYELIKAKKQIEKDQQKSKQTDGFSYYIQNNTGEKLLFKTQNMASYKEIKAGEEESLDMQFFQAMQRQRILQSLKDSQLPKKQHKKMVSSDSESEEEQVQEGDFTIQKRPCRSVFRRKNYRFLKNEPKKLQFKLNVDFLKDVKWESSAFEINIQTLGCSKVYIDDKKELYVICQTQQIDAKRVVVIRSPMQIKNDLKIPLEIQLTNVGKHESQDKDFDIRKVAKMDKILVQANQSVDIPLRNCGFAKVQILPLNTSDDQKSFETTQEVGMSLMMDEQDIFDQLPLVLSSEILQGNKSDTEKIFMVLSSNTYSFRSYVDFNTQQTEYISLRYLSVSPPFVFQNLLPAPLTSFFKEVSDRQGLFDLDMSHNSQLQVLSMNPLANFKFSIIIPGYERSEFKWIKQEKDEAQQICSELLDKKATQKSRFITEKKLSFALQSQFQNSFNVQAHIAFIQCQFQVTFYAQYWILNNTQMPVEVMVNNQMNSERINLPYEKYDYDFESVKNFQSQDKKVSVKDDKSVTMSKLDNQTVVGDDHLQSLIDEQRVKTTHKTYFGRIKPWEAYKFYQNENSGLLGLLTQKEIDSVQVVYFTQEDYREAIEEDKEESKSQDDSQFEQRFKQAMMGRYKNKLNKHDQQSMVSKTSLQMLSHQEKISRQKAIPLASNFLGSPDNFEAPIEDRDQLKRIVLFSESAFEDKVDDNDTKKTIGMRICNSKWQLLPFDMAELQKETIQLQDQTQQYCTKSMYELVVNVHYLSMPFSYSKMIEFKSRYIMVNKCHETLQIIQAECQELGMFKVYPCETSCFHWTDHTKPREINVKFQDHEYSGPIKIDSIGEMVVRLRGTFDNESVILSISITEEQRTLYIVITDVSYAPPYRIENLTKSNFNISQVGSRQKDFDELRPYCVLPYAMSYPLNARELQLWVASSPEKDPLSTFKVDQINKIERIEMEYKSYKYLLEIINEQTITILRISYLEDKVAQIQESKISEGTKSSIQLNLKAVGISLVNSQARELVYIFIQNQTLDFKRDKLTTAISYTVGDYQIDNQLVRKDDSIILQKDKEQKSSKVISTICEQGQIDSGKQFLTIKLLHFENNAIQNLVLFKYCYFVLSPLLLNLDGNICDEVIRYFSELSAQRKKFKLIDDNVEMAVELIDEKKFTDLQIDQANQMKAQRKIYFEEFYLHDIKLKFTFESSPVMLREVGLNTTLKFLLVMMSNLKKVKLNFSAYHIQNQQSLWIHFLALLKKHYIKQCYGNQQILSLISSMGLFGNLSESINDLSSAIESLMYHPINDENFLKGVAVGSVVFVKKSLTAVTKIPVAIFGSMRDGFVYLYQAATSKKKQESIELEQIDQEMLESDIEQIRKDLDSFSTPLNLIDNQNRIWKKIIMSEFKRQEIQQKKHTIEQKLSEDSDMNYIEIAQRKLQQQESNQGIRAVAGNIFQAFYQMPSSLLQRTAKTIDDMNQRFEENSFKPHKIRPPRFTSFTMELEPYNLKKAFSLELLDLINVNKAMFYSETIEKLYVLQNYVLIFTAQRIICVQEQQNFMIEDVQVQKKLEKSELNQKISLDSLKNKNEKILEIPNTNKGYQMYSGFEAQSREKEGPELLTNKGYFHWQITFENILNIRIDDVLVDDLDKNGQPIFKKINQEDIDEGKTPRHNLRIWYSDSNDAFDLRLQYRDVCIWQRDYRKLKKVVEELQARGCQLDN